jgi:group II intron reverse transcriptase/maturase
MNTQRIESVSTKRLRIAELSRRHAGRALTSLNGYLDKPWLEEAYRRLKKGKAVGIDGQGVDEYGLKLDERLTDLLGRAKSGSYQAPPVRRVQIPKAGSDEKRPIGIPTTEDKVLQMAAHMLLEAVYEEEFYDFSYGFRAGKSAHQALAQIRKDIHEKRINWIIDADIRKFFDTLCHRKLKEILRQRVNDGVISRLTGKWLKAGYMESGQLTAGTEGTPQGGIISPLLANVYLHEVLDGWFAEQVQPVMKGASFLVRYADDFIMGFHDEEDARRVFKVLAKRFGKYGLTIHPEKTRLVRFTLPWQNEEGERSESFDFLGFTHHWEKNGKGNYVVRRRTAKTRFARALKSVGEWCRDNRHGKIREQIKTIKQKLQGHYAYYGIRGNYRNLERYRTRVLRIWYRWLKRRTRNCAGLQGQFSDFARKAAELYGIRYPCIIHPGV